MFFLDSQVIKFLPAMFQHINNAQILGYFIYGFGVSIMQVTMVLNLFGH